MDTSQKLPIRFGETLKKYIARGLDKSNLVLIPLTLAGYARYLKGLKDDLTAFEPSPDPMLAELQAIVAPLEIGKADQDWSPLRKLYSRKDVFGLDLYEAGFGAQIEEWSRSFSQGKVPYARHCINMLLHVKQWMFDIKYSELPLVVRNILSTFAPN